MAIDQPGELRMAGLDVLLAALASRFEEIGTTQLEATYGRPATRLRSALALGAVCDTPAHVRVEALSDVTRLDAEQLERALVSRTDSSSDSSVIVLLMERLLEDLARLAVGASTVGSGQTAARLGPAVDDYAHDARRERNGARALLAIALVLFVATGLAAWWSVSVAQQPAGVGAIRLMGPLFVALATGSAGLYLLRASAVSRRAAREFTRIQRAFDGLDAYLAPLPAPTRHLLRATMAQTLFPRLLEDQDPLRHVAWPGADTLTQSLYDSGYHEPEE